MRIIVLGFILLGWLASCKKNVTVEENGTEKIDSLKKTEFDEIFQVHFNLDSVPQGITLSKEDWGMLVGTNYTINSTKRRYTTGVTFNYLKKPSFNFTMGSVSIDTKNGPEAAHKAFLSVFSPGSKRYDSLRYFNVPNDTNRVELTYTDANGIGWSSTKITTINNNITQSISQPGGTFIVRTMKDVIRNLYGDRGVIIDATFNCILYEINGTRQKTLSDGTLTAIISE